MIIIIAVGSSVYCPIYNDSLDNTARSRSRGIFRQLGYWSLIRDLNSIQLYYVIGDHGDPVVLLHGWPEACT
jgi:hypothetical protein